MVKLATACIHCVYNKEKNLEKYFSYIDQAAKEGAKLIAFPEQSLQGYLPSLVEMDFEEFHYQYHNAELVPEGVSVQKVIAKAKEKDIYVVFGMTEKDPDDDNKMYNTMVLVGPEGYIGKYRKVHLPFDELHTYYPGKEFPVFQTRIGKIGMLICYDKSFPESARELALGGAEIMVMSTAWPFENPENSGNVENDELYYVYKTYDQIRPLENMCFFMSSNQVGLTGKIHYFGCSNIVSPQGHIIATTGENEGVAYAEVDLKEEIHFARTEEFGGLNMLKDRQIKAYKRLALEY